MRACEDDNRARFQNNDVRPTALLPATLYEFRSFEER
jgi:hypothetical protein